MGKSKPRSNKVSAQNRNTNTKTTTTSVTLTLQPVVSTSSAGAADPILGYKIRVLLHDFLDFTKDPNAARRINSTTNEHYISASYFDDSQAAVIKAALVDIDLSKFNTTAAATEYAQADADTEEALNLKQLG
ncbi:hypothetical protein QQS21_011614 [Conoideocrella luteorostrata]|uniref:Uncharacterized protein n=1 Tax=Conoideocrella luteorostrata TaxID=1105319 RepID=A0AAJ0CF45_9HYPO|nr:hypothetical protein QQS21_011614 [Conoideocrella luteorostrata]